ncbi:lysophospholipid acyltransferase family protein [Coralliovum pocilloporae]|uniref:lysophospholipid acyltransferase family protein n=1 Tax=Coralliovum pocilloporae TaxID=3066369 RepID=UPI0033073A71
MFLRSLIFNVAFYAWMILVMLMIIPAFVLPARLTWFLIRLWVKGNLWLQQMIIGNRIEIRGLENIPEGGFIVASKHQSFWEAFALANLFPDPAYIYKKQLGWIPMFGWYLVKFRMIPVDRGRRGAALKALQEYVEVAIAEGRQVIIFPEGTRRTPGDEPAYKYGVSHLYHELGCECLPIGVNAGLFWPRRTFMRQKGTIVIDIRPSIKAGLDKRTFTTELADTIEASSNALILEALEENPDLILPELTRSRLDLIRQSAETGAPA